MDKNTPLKLEEVLPFRFGFLKALPIYLWIIGLAVFWTWVFHFSRHPMETTASNILICGFFGTMLVSAVSYLIAYGVLFSLFSYAAGSDVGIDFLGEYIKCNLWGFDVWVYQPEGKVMMQSVVLPRGVKVTDFLCRHFFDQGTDGYVLRYPTGGWFRRSADLWLVKEHKPSAADNRISRRGKSVFHPPNQVLTCRDRQGASVPLSLGKLFELIEARGIGDGINFANELVVLARSYMEIEGKRLKAV